MKRPESITARPCIGLAASRGHASAILNAAQTRERLGNAARVDRCLHKAAASDASAINCFGGLYLRIAAVWVRIGDREKAADVMRALLLRRPDNAVAQKALKELLAQ